MSDTFFTYKSKSIHCKMWDRDVTLKAKYRLDNDRHPEYAEYCFCTCPILENLKLPPEQQDKEYELYRFCNMDKECLSSANFESKTEV